MNNIKLLRIQKGLSQKEAAEKAGIKQNHWSYIETGKNQPSIKTLKKIAKVLNAEPFDILQEVS